MDTKEFKGVIEDIVDARMSKKGITKYVSAIIKNVNGDGSVNVYLPPDTEKIVSGVLNKTGENLSVGDSVELCTKNGKTSNAWVSVKHGTNLGDLSELIVESNIFRNLFNVGNAKTSADAEININKTNNQISINGSSSIVTNIFLDSPKANKDEEGIILKAGTYTATIKKVSGSLSGGDIEFRLRKSDGESIYNGTRVWTQKILSGVQDDAVYSNTFTLEEETRLHWIGYFAGELRTFNNLVLQFQIEESPTPTSYTPWAGYIVESGSNAKGSWIKYSDGTIEEWGTYTINSNNVSWSALTTGLYYSPSYSHTLPVTLINTDNINTTCAVFSRSSHFDWAVRPSVGNTDAPDISLTYTVLSFNLVTATNTKRNVVIRWFVKGRWK